MSQGYALSVKLSALLLQHSRRKSLHEVDPAHLYVAFHGQAKRREKGGRAGGNHINLIGLHMISKTMSDVLDVFNEDRRWTPKTGEHREWRCEHYIGGDMLPSFTPIISQL